MKQKAIFILLVFACLLPPTLSAYDFEADGIYYNINGCDVTVTAADDDFDTFDYSGNLTIPKTVTFNGTTYSVTAIGDYAFYSCNNLTSVTISNSVISIGDKAFLCCSSLRSVNIPNSIISIGDLAFDSCSGLISLNIPNSVTSLGFSTFSNCSNLTSVTIGNSVTAIPEEAFASCSSLTSITIPNSVTTINDYAFCGCSSLTDIDIPNSVINIGENVFKDCTSLNSITLGKSIQTIAISAFDNCTNLKAVYFNAMYCEDWGFWKGISPFINCPLERLVFGDEVRRIPAGIAYGRSRLTSINIPNSVRYIGNHAFYECGFTNIHLPNSVEFIGEYAFCCSWLTSIAIPESVNYIGQGAFNYCSIHILIFNAINCRIGYPGSGDDWPSGCFEACPLETIIIGDSVTVIPNLFLLYDYYPFSVSDVFCYSKMPPTCYDDSFHNFACTLHVPPASLAAYFTAPYWQNFNEIVGDAVKPEGLRITPDSAELVIGETLALFAEIAPPSAMPSTITWYSDNPAIASIDNGIVTAVSVGECNIKAVCLDKEVVCHIMVYNNRISLDYHEAQLLPNHLLKLTPTSLSEELPTLVVTSSDPNVAAARVMNGRIQVVGITEGIATITVGSVDDAVKTDSCIVTVYTENGDTNSDGFVNISDVTHLISYLMNNYLNNEFSSINSKNADINGDGTINISDVTMLINLVMAM